MIAGLAPARLRRLAKYAARGVLPVPPTVRFPTLSAGTAVGCTLKTPDEKSEDLAVVMTPKAISAGASAARATRAPIPSLAHSVCSQSPLRTFGFGERIVQQRLEPWRFSFGFARRRCFDARRQRIGDVHATERLGNHESIPAVQAPRAARHHTDADDRDANALCRDERATRKPTGRAPRTVRRPGDLTAALELTNDANQRQRRTDERSGP